MREYFYVTKTILVSILILDWPRITEIFLLVLLRAIKNKRSTGRYQIKHFLEASYFNFNEYFTGISMDWFSTQQKLLNTQQLVFSQPADGATFVVQHSAAYYRAVRLWLIFWFGKFGFFMSDLFRNWPYNACFYAKATH